MWTTPALSQKRNGSKLHMVMTTHFLLNGPLPSSANGDVAGITSTTTRWPCRRSEASDLKTTGTQNCGHRHMKLTTISLKRITQEKNWPVYDCFDGTPLNTYTWPCGSLKVISTWCSTPSQLWRVTRGPNKMHCNHKDNSDSLFMTHFSTP